MILTVLLISIFGTFSFGLSPTYSIACLARFITGIGDAFCFLRAIRIASRWFPNKQVDMALPIFLIGGDGFGSLYLQQVKHMTPLQASYPPMMIFIGIILSIIYTSRSLIIYTALFFLLGVINSAPIISYSLVTESNAKILTATSISIVSLAGLSGGAIFPPLFGHIMDKMGNFTIIILSVAQ